MSTSEGCCSTDSSLAVEGAVDATWRVIHIRVKKHRGNDFGIAYHCVRGIKYFGLPVNIGMGKVEILDC